MASWVSRREVPGRHAMFESLSDRLQGVFRSLRGEVRLTAETVESALREIRMALLEADVNFKVVKAFIDRVRDRAVDQEVLKSLTPAQQVVRIVRDEMLALFGDTTGGLPDVAGQAARDPAARAPGFGQDDNGGQAGSVSEEAGAAPVAGVHRRPAPGSHPAAGRRCKAGRRACARSGRRSRSRSPRERRPDGGAQRRLRRRDRGHGRTAAHRRRPDG